MDLRGAAGQIGPRAGGCGGGRGEACGEACHRLARGLQEHGAVAARPARAGGQGQGGCSTRRAAAARRAGLARHAQDSRWRRRRDDVARSLAVLDCRVVGEDVHGGTHVLPCVSGQPHRLLLGRRAHRHAVHPVPRGATGGDVVLLHQIHRVLRGAAAGGRVQRQRARGVPAHPCRRRLRGVHVASRAQAPGVAVHSVPGQKQRRAFHHCHCHPDRHHVPRQDDPDHCFHHGRGDHPRATLAPGSGGGGHEHHGGGGGVDGGVLSALYRPGRCVAKARAAKDSPDVLQGHQQNSNGGWDATRHGLLRGDLLRPRPPGHLQEKKGKGATLCFRERDSGEHPNRGVL
mmetsp:Transcript_24355/g.60563  ORF Transcript_24355/g.60563 Transcript_24355/m.60563 type:complete len:345 (+) Transcript_24355:989-2023(+)